MATLINGKNKLNANSNEFDSLIAEAEEISANADEVLAKFEAAQAVLA